MKQMNNTDMNQTRRRPIVLIVVVLGIFLLLISPWIVWLLRPQTEIVTAVYDKTIPDNAVRNHTGIMWFLKQIKSLPPDGERFDYYSDYYGYISASEQIKPLNNLGEHVDVIYIADTYGIYKDAGDRIPGASNLIYGGMSQQDVDQLRTFLNRNRQTTLIAEYNTFATPTHPHIRQQLYELLQVRWTGWIGQYVTDLGSPTEVPRWVMSRYEQQHDSPWPYEGPGFLLTDEKEHIEVLVMGDDIGNQGCQFSYTQDGVETLGLSESVYYNKTFDIVEPLSRGDVLAEYQLDVTPSGKTKLDKFGLPASFPAVVSTETPQSTTYYFAGNVADLPFIPKFHYLAWVPPVMRWITTDSLKNEHGFYWNTYIPLLTAIYERIEEKKQIQLPEVDHNIYQSDGTSMTARTKGTMLQIFEDDSWNDFFVKGINLGTALPGKWFTEFPEDKALYYHWLDLMGSAGFNTIRIYTLLDPQFYNALHLYNRLHPDKPLWLLQEIWPEEEPPDNNYLLSAYRDEFQQEIKYVIDAVHGRASISERPGRASGVYQYDVSAHVLGYLVGRELEPHEVETTDEKNPGYFFSGDYLRTSSQATPTEAWLAESADYTLAYQEKTYGWQHPVAIVNWPTLDALEHPSERDEFGMKEGEYNDSTTVDINNITLGPKMLSGLFGAYHIYPNYPDFMNNEPQYNQYTDELGRFRYRGYLKEFMDIHTAYPALVAEFGLATGMGNAHYSPDGYHHGSMSEIQQAEGIIRMFEAFRAEDYAGGVIFEWMDEWAKKTWTTEPYMLPYDRQILWHNVVDPEQNYGLLAVESVKPRQAGAQLTGSGSLRSVELRMDASYLHIDIELKETIDFSQERLLIGLDTYDRERGEMLYSPDLKQTSPSGMEYLIDLDGLHSSRLLVIPPYNSAEYRFASYDGIEETGMFEPMVKLINKKRMLEDGTVIQPRYEHSSVLHFGSLVGSTNHWITDERELTLRIPWTRINVADPSEGRVIDDPERYYSDPLRDVLSSSLSEGIGVSVILLDKNNTLLDALPKESASTPFILPWNPWNYPDYRFRLKAGYQLLTDYLQGEISD